MPSKAHIQWRSFPALRLEQFANFVRTEAQEEGAIDSIVDRILLRRDECEKLLLKNLIIQIALYAGLVVAPTDGSFPVFGLPFKAVREVMLFVLGFAQILAVLVASRIKVQNEFIQAWQLHKFPNKLAVPLNLSYGTIMAAGSWYPSPSTSMQRTRTVKALAVIMALSPAIILLLMPIVALTVGVFVSIDVWQHPSLQSTAISKATVIFYIFSYLLNLFYAIADTVPLPYRR